MSSPTDHELAGADYRDAKASVGPHRRVLADAELARADWLRRHRAVPAGDLYDATTGDPIAPELVALSDAIAAAAADVDWCRALVLACGEVVKGVSFEDAVTDPATIREARARAEERLLGESGRR